MSTFTHHARRFANVAVILAGAAALSAASNQFLGQVARRRVKPRFKFYPGLPGSDPKLLFVCFHGLWSGPERWAKLLEDMRRQGAVLQMVIGGNVMDAPAAMLAELERRGLLSHDLYLDAVSAGTLTHVLFSRLYEQETGREIHYHGIHGGPPYPVYTRWPHRSLPQIVRYVEPGPIVWVIWKSLWSIKLLAAMKTGDTAEKERIKGVLRMPTVAVVSVARLLIVGIDLQPGELSGWMLVTGHPGDPLIGLTTAEGIDDGIREWVKAARDPGKVITHIFDTPGHVDFDRCAKDYLLVMRRLLASRLGPPDMTLPDAA